MMSEWERVDTESTAGGGDDAATTRNAAARWLAERGLGKQAAKILEVTDAEDVDDLKLIDEKLVEQVIKDADLKLVSAKKFREALQELHSTPALAPSSATDAAGGGDAGGESASAPAAPPPPVQERIVICIDRSGSMGSPFKETTLNIVRGESKNSVAERTRMEAVKAMFYAFRDRVESMTSGTFELGLLQFDQYIDKMLDLTCNLNKFESIVDDMQKRGQTAIYSAIIEAAKMLAPTFDKDNPIDLRILVLTDGQNNSGAPPQEALAAVNAIHGTVDAILVGDTPDANLRRIVTATEGQCYQISTLGEGFELLEAESVVSLAARRGGEEKVLKPRPEVDFSQIKEKAMVHASAADAMAADRARDRDRDKKVLSLKAWKTKGDRGDPAGDSGSVGSGGGGGARDKRIMSELRQVPDDDVAPDGIYIFPSPEDIGFWNVLMTGPADSPFAGGVFALTVKLPSDYPFKAPAITFQTPIYHCNVSSTGGICLDILKDTWSPALSVYKALLSIRDLLSNPNAEDALRQWIAELTMAHQKSNGVDTRYYDQAKEETQKHASRSIDDWKQTWAVSTGPVAADATPAPK